jgi:hypothetical protein
MKLRSYFILHDAKATEGGAAVAEPEPRPAEPPAPEVPSADINKRIDPLQKDHGDSNGAVRALLAERDQTAAQLAETRTKLPREGHRVIDPDTGRVLDEFNALGRKPADLKAALDELDALKARVAERDRKDHHGRVAAVHGFKAPVYTDLAERDKLDVVIVEDRDPRVPSKTIQVAKVRGKDDKGAETLTPLEEYAAKNWGDYLPSLKGTAAPAPSPLGSPPPSGGPPRPPVKAKDPDRPRSNPLS